MFSRQIIFRNLLVIFIVLEKKTTIESDCGNDKDTSSSSSSYRRTRSVFNIFDDKNLSNEL